MVQKFRWDPFRTPPKWRGQYSDFLGAGVIYGEVDFCCGRVAKFKTELV